MSPEENRDPYMDCGSDVEPVLDIVGVQDTYIAPLALSSFSSCPILLAGPAAKSREYESRLGRIHRAGGGGPLRIVGIRLRRRVVTSSELPDRFTRGYERVTLRYRK